MHSIDEGPIPAALAPARLRLLLAESKVPAGFPSPADDFAVKGLDLNELLVTHPQATYFMRAKGLSMVDAGIFDGDLLVVTRAVAPRHGNVVVAQVDGGFTVKKLYKRGGRIKLQAANPTFPDIVPRPDQEITVFGVVTASVHQL